MAEDGIQSGEPVQVVFVDEDGSYRLDDEALRRVVSHEAARGLPVCVVSVAGATRGGKSFLLDFFLRYLRATDDERQSDVWIGADDQPLTGFKWRGGSDRETNGIVIWSEPIVVTLASEEANKVAVVLMDTQGTFDSSSTVRDSSIIFAMSSLLSSVQIYNISQNIKEDDLQYLHLFTEYGKLAQDESVDSPFQVLQFLVRDWSYAYEHPVGAEGGRQLLDKRLQIRNEQAQELRELRQHVRSVFEAVRCFLLPHPGLTVATSPVFRGCLQDISSEFKNALLEFVPSLFAPKNITVKTVLGQEMTVHDLPQYFQSYIEIFNSDSLPTPVTVTKALSMASLETAVQAARAAYCGHMERGGSARSVARGAVPCLHAAALQAARDAFAARRTLAPHTLADDKLQTLLQELDAMLPNYVAMNLAKILEAVANSKTLYEESMVTEKCLQPAELEEMHAAAKEVALAFILDSRAPTDFPDEDDDIDDRNTLEQEVESLLPLYRERNAARIESAIGAAREALEAPLRAALDATRCLHPHRLLRIHHSAKAKALEIFDGAWKDERSAMNEHRSVLIEDMESICGRYVEENNTYNKHAVTEALEQYGSVMERVFGGKCLHPRDLNREHEHAQKSAAANFLAQRKQYDHSSKDIFQQDLQRGTIARYFEFTRRNEALNEQHVETALAGYNATMNPARGGGNVVFEIFGPPDFSLLTRHEPAKNAAIEMFKHELRRNGPEHDEDQYLESLDKKISESFSWMQLKLFGNVALQVSNYAVMAAMIFKR